MAKVNYYVVEVRLPIQISDALSVEDAAHKARRQIHENYGVDVSNWFLRIFEFGGEEGKLGVINEYFSNPTGKSFRLVDANTDKHQEWFEKGIDPNE